MVSFYKGKNMKNFATMSDQEIKDYLLPISEEIIKYDTRIKSLNDDTKDNRRNKNMLYRNKNALERIINEGNAELTQRQTKRQHNAWLESLPQYASFKQCPQNLKSMIQWRKV